MALKGEKPENLIKRSKLISKFKEFHQSLCDNALDDLTFQEMIDDFIQIKEITNLNEEDAQVILKLLSSKNESEEFVEYLKGKNLNLPKGLISKIINMNKNIVELKNMKVGDIKTAFDLSLKDSKEFFQILQQCKIYLI